MPCRRRPNAGLSNGLTFLTAYTWSKSISGPSDIGGQVGGGFYIGAPQDIYYMRGDRSVSGFDVTQRFVQTVLYDVPFFRNLHGSAKIRAGWLAGLHHHDLPERLPDSVSARTSTPPAPASPPAPTWFPARTATCPADQRTWKHWFNTAAFAQAPYGRFGTSPRTDAFRLPGMMNVDFSINKSFRFAETKSLEFRSEIFNFLKHYNPDPATVDLNSRSATFGAVGGGVQGITTRVIQLGAKLVF